MIQANQLEKRPSFNVETALILDTVYQYVATLITIKPQNEFSKRVLLSLLATLYHPLLSILYDLKTKMMMNFFNDIVRMLIP
jgi:hypothetical protein